MYHQLFLYHISWLLIFTIWMYITIYTKLSKYTKSIHVVSVNTYMYITFPWRIKQFAIKYTPLLDLKTVVLCLILCVSHHFLYSLTHDIRKFYIISYHHHLYHNMYSYSVYRTSLYSTQLCLVLYLPLGSHLKLYISYKLVAVL